MRQPVQAQPVTRGSWSSSRKGIGVSPSDICVTATVEDGQACINTPIGKKCVGVPSWIPNGDAASVCAHICTHWRIPTGACITATVAGQQVAHQCFGKC
jgi:hypothetical protein